MTIHGTISIDAAPERVWVFARDRGTIAECVSAPEVSAVLGDERWSRLACGVDVRERILEHSDVDRRMPRSPKGFARSRSRACPSAPASGLGFGPAADQTANRSAARPV